MLWQNFFDKSVKNNLRTNDNIHMQLIKEMVTQLLSIKL